MNEELTNAVPQIVETPIAVKLISRQCVHDSASTYWECPRCLIEGGFADARRIERVREVAQHWAGYDNGGKVEYALLGKYILEILNGEFPIVEEVRSEVHVCKALDGEQ